MRAFPQMTPIAFGLLTVWQLNVLTAEEGRVGRVTVHSPEEAREALAWSRELLEREAASVVTR